MKKHHQRKLYRVTTTHAPSAKVTTTTHIRCKGQGHSISATQSRRKQQHATTTSTTNNQIRTCNQCDLNKDCRPIVPLQLALMLILLLLTFVLCVCGGTVLWTLCLWCLMPDLGTLHMCGSYHWLHLAPVVLLHIHPIALIVHLHTMRYI